MFQRPDPLTGFPITLQYPVAVSSKAPSDREIKTRMEELYPPQNVNPAESLPSTMLERDLKNETENVVKVLELLH